MKYFQYYIFIIFFCCSFNKFANAQCTQWEKEFAPWLCDKPGPGFPGNPNPAPLPPVTITPKPEPPSIFPGIPGAPLPPPGGGGGGGAVVSVTSVVNNLKAGCSKDIADFITANGWTNKISSEVNRIFKIGNKYNITFFNKSAWPSTYPPFPQNDAALAWPRYVNGVLKVDIYLNDPLLANASKEYLSVTLLHEIAHGIIKYENKDGNTNGHNTMYQEYISEMKNGLIEMFPGMNTNDADALAYEGLLNTIWGSATALLFPEIWKNREAIWKAYREGQKGTKCTN